jgi:phosphate transport system ATP-binding protein
MAEETGDTENQIKMRSENLSVYYRQFRAIAEVNLPIYAQKITAIIGPSGCGKSTLLRAMNRMNDLVNGSHAEGQVYLDGQPLYGSDVDVVDVRRRIGMVFQRPNPFPKSIYDNVAYGPRLYGIRRKGELDELVEKALRQAALWDEVKDKLHQSARAIAVEPEVILMDEPAAALDPISTLRIEELMHDIVKEYTIVIVTHNMQQAARVSDYTAMMMLKDQTRSGTVIEFGKTHVMFTNPKDKHTEDYVTGRFG